MIKYKILATQTVKGQQFINYWYNIYDYKADQQYKYSKNIRKREFNSQEIQELFEWKNGMPLSGIKRKTVTFVKKNLRTVNALKRHYNDVLFHQKFGKISLVWRIFLQHIIKPKEFPLYDQHIHRAYIYLTTGKVQKGKGTVSEKLSFYKYHYTRFYYTFCKEVKLKNKDKLDDALWAFGKFLSRYPKIINQ
jgi:hypothetical protein